jgi:hypothetical protein
MSYHDVRTGLPKCDKCDKGHDALVYSGGVFACGECAVRELQRQSRKEGREDEIRSFLGAKRGTQH